MTCVYAEAMLIALDDEKKGYGRGRRKRKESVKQKKYIFCKENDRDALFEEIDKKISVPLIPEFKDFIIDELIKNEILIPLEVLSIEQSFDAYMLRMRNDEKDVIDIVNRGLASGGYINTECRQITKQFQRHQFSIKILAGIRNCNCRTYQRFVYSVV